MKNYLHLSSRPVLIIHKLQNSIGGIAGLSSLTS
jgi:hypothetical protein